MLLTSLLMLCYRLVSCLMLIWLIYKLKKRSVTDERTDRRTLAFLELLKTSCLSKL